MSEPSWKTELCSELLAFTDYGEGEMDDLMRVVMPHIDAAYERGLVAGRSQSGYTTRRKRKEDPCPTAAPSAGTPSPASSTEAAGEP